MTKNIAEKVVHDLAHKFNIRTKVVRPSGIAGHSETGWLGYQQIGYGGMITKISELASQGVTKITFDYEMDKAEVNIIPVDYLVNWIETLQLSSTDDIFSITNLSFTQQKVSYLDAFVGMCKPFGIQVQLGVAQNNIDEMVNNSKLVKSLSDYLNNSWTVKTDKIRSLITKSQRENNCDLNRVFERMSEKIIQDQAQIILLAGYRNNQKQHLVSLNTKGTSPYVSSGQSLVGLPFGLH